jgi:hypothetical protein
LGAKLSARQIQLLDIGHRRLVRLRMIGPLLIRSAGQSGKALLLEG